MSVAGTPLLLLADPEKLSTRLERAACWTCADTSEDALAGTRMMRAIAQSAEAPGLIHRGFLQQRRPHPRRGAGRLRHRRSLPEPASRSTARFLDKLAAQGPHTPVALSISGLWLLHHFEDYRWLLDQQASGALDIVWVNHTYPPPLSARRARRSQFPADEGVDPDVEILETERLLIANGQTPSLFFRFPGLISIVAVDAGGAPPSLDLARRRRLAGARPAAGRGVDHPRPPQRQ